MSRLINANELLAEVAKAQALEPDKAVAKIILLITEAESMDAAEVVHGHNLKDHNSAFECSVCGWEDWDTLTADTSEYNYCPNCGAKMDGDRNG
ncbi:MAG: hypothetical protein J6Q53_05075 [Oscillospiraceae bacterium]|nr:hypothetical protein [Oscillospiraceae bacterium]